MSGTKDGTKGGKGDKVTPIWTIHLRANVLEHSFHVLSNSHFLTPCGPMPHRLLLSSRQSLNPSTNQPSQPGASTSTPTGSQKCQKRCSRFRS
jgi:hypothetical protein